MAGRKGEYLFKRAGSENWHIRFVYPVKPGQDWPKRVEFSLGTADRLKAEIEASEHIANHKIVLHTMRAIHGGAVERRNGHRYAPGREHAGPDGGRIVATADQLIFLDASGSVAKIERNMGEGVVITMPRAAALDAGIVRADPPPKKTKADTDSELIAAWVKAASVTPHIVREARLVFDVFKSITSGKRFADATKADGKALVEHLFAQGQAYMTTRKKVGHLRAIVNVAIKDDVITGKNPFANVMPEQTKGDSVRRLPFDDDDMAVARAKGPTVMSKSEWLLWTILATTGMRLEEAVTIEREFSEKGIRYVIVGEKTKASERRVPLPDAVLALIPNKITGPLFPGEHARMLSKRMNNRLKTLGIWQSQVKVIHSLRHRAKDRLRAEGVATDMQYECLGHEKVTVAQGYGHGYPMSVIKPIIDKIGY